MSGYEASAPLTGTLLSSKGAAAPSNSVASLMDDFAVEALASVQPSGPPSQVVPEKTPMAGRDVREDGAPWPAPDVKVAAPQERIKLSLRLSADQHLRLKLAAAHLRLSSQALLMTALDEYLGKIAPGVREGECTCLMTGAVDQALPCRGEFCRNAG